MQPFDPGPPPADPNGYPQQGYPQQQQGYPQQGYPQQQQGYPQQHPSQHPPAYGQPGPGSWQQQQLAQQAKPASGAPGVFAIILSVLASGPLGLAIYNLHQAQRMALDPDLPKWIRAVACDANMNRVLLFGGVAGAMALLGVILGLVGRKATAGKVGIVFAGLLLAGSAYAQIGRSTFDGNYPPGKFEREEEEEADKKRKSDRESDTAPSRAPISETDTPILNPKQGAFRLGRQLGLAALGRARGAKAAGDRVFAKAEKTAKDLGVTLPQPPAVGADETKNSAEALHYLLDVAGKPVANGLSAKHGPAHAAAFELGVKLTLLNLLYLPDDELGQGLGSTCERLSVKAGVPDAAIRPLLSKIKANGSSSAVGDAAVAAGDAIDRELATAPATPVPAAPKPRAPQHGLDDRLD